MQNPTTSQPRVHLWKDLIRIGRYRHPGSRLPIHVNRRRLEHWARMFTRMSANGVRVHIPVDHSNAAADNRGYVLAMKRDGDRLMALCQFIGPDAIRDASRNQVSIGVSPVFIDGKGHAYRDAIVHVALTPVPVVPGQDPFIPADNLLTLSAASFQRRANMAQTMLPCSDETLSALHELVPGLADIPPDQKVDHLLHHLQSLTTTDDDPANLSLAPALLEAVKTKRDLCVSRGALTPAIADVLLARLAPGGQVIGLSRDDSDATLALSIFAALTENKPIHTGERTTSQTRLLRPTPGENSTQELPLYQKMAAMADGKSVQL